MEFGHYIFAVFIALLVCGVLFVYRRLFSDLKGEKQLLDEKDAKLLRLYQSLEDVMEEFYDVVEQSKREIEDRIGQLDRREPGPPQQAPFRPAPAVDELVGDSFQTTMEKREAAAPPPGSGRSRQAEEIIRLGREGMPQAEIARTLGITQNEVALVLGIGMGNAADKKG